jgi:hypothetical protein
VVSLAFGLAGIYFLARGVYFVQGVFSPYLPL